MNKRLRPGTTIGEIETALRATGGFISQAAVKLQVTQSAVSQRISRSKYLQTVLEEIKNSYLDLAESKLLGKINKEDLGAICFYLKCKGKERGYIERSQVELDQAKDTIWRVERHVVYPDKKKDG